MASTSTSGLAIRYSRMVLPSATLSGGRATAGEAMRLGAVARAPRTRPTAIRPPQKIKRMERMSDSEGLLARSRVDVGLDVLRPLPGRRARLQLALGRRGVALSLGAVAAKDRHLGAGQ